ncbi:apolipoprotein N-acyltransferase [Treponema sp. OMZ 840]|uniref:apolipoprotein N-acyltransferase n=1 Tax=Treponema sp. OMZ 840 TaxID=244313 RepID=UPI003D8D8859
MRRFLQVFCAFFSAIIMALAIQNEFLLFGSPFLGLFALVPLYTALAQASSFKKAGLLMSLQMLCTHIFSSFWLGYFKDFAIFTLGATALTYAVFGYYIGGLFFMPFYITRKSALEEGAGMRPFNSPMRILLFAFLWTVYEWVKSVGFLAYPWGTLIMSAWRWKLLTQIVDITGTWGIGFLFSLFNAVIAEGLLLLPSILGSDTNNALHIRQQTKKRIFSYINTAVFCVSLFVLSTAYGIYRYTEKRTPIKKIRTLLVQPNFDSWLAESGKNALELSINLTEEQLNKTDRKPDVILWSETILPYALPAALHYYTYSPEKKPLISFIRENGIPFISGAPVELTADLPLAGTRTEDSGTRTKDGFAHSVSVMREFNNAAVYFDGEGNWLDFYGKVQLVPFAEIIPYADKAWMRSFMQALVGFSSGWTPGKHYTVFDIPLKNGSAKISTPICFEDAFPYICRNLFFAGSEVFFNLTNDAWSRTDSAEIQHYVIASYRAQEFRTSLVRCTNAGFTSVTDPAGRILYSLPLFESTAGIVDVPVYKRTLTVYAVLGDWLPILLGGLWGAFYLVFYIRRRIEGHKTCPAT